MRELTKEEKSAIRRLKRLAKDWPESLALVTVGGGLGVYDADEYGDARTNAYDDVDPHALITGIDLYVDNTV